MSCQRDQPKLGLPPETSNRLSKARPRTALAGRRAGQTAGPQYISRPSADPGAERDTTGSSNRQRSKHTGIGAFWQGKRHAAATQVRNRSSWGKGRLTVESYWDKRGAGSGGFLEKPDEIPRSAGTCRRFCMGGVICRAHGTCGRVGSSTPGSCSQFACRHRRARGG